jgi:hypothetical protein
MALFRNENPNLGPLTTINEVGLSGASNTSAVASDFKPTTREILTVTFEATDTNGWVFVSPWNCKVVGVRFVCTVVANSTQTVQLYKMPVASQPAAPSGTGSKVLTAAATPVGSGATANVVAFSGLTTTAADLLLAPGDLIGYNFSGAPTSLVGGQLQIEVQQIS